jgi:hypothetical protein
MVRSDPLAIYAKLQEAQGLQAYMFHLAVIHIFLLWAHHDFS